MRRLAITGAALALVLSACGGGDGTAHASTTTGPTSTTTSEPLDGADDTTTTTEVAAYDPTESVFTDADHGSVVSGHPGDTIRVRLPVGDPADPLWVLANDPDTDVVTIGDSLLWTPSEPGAEATHFEWVIWIVGTGDTSIVFSRGPLTPTTRTVGFSIESVDP